MNELTCGVVADLLPNYAEGLTGEETNKLIEEHISLCPACREALAAMREDAPAEKLTEPEHTEIEFLKKNRKRNRRILLGSIAAALVLALGLLALKYFVIGTKADDGILVKLELDGNELAVECSAWNENRVVSSVSFTEEGGVVDISARTALKSPFFNDVVSKTYTAKTDIKKVTLNSSTVLREEDGKKMISDSVKQMIRDSWANYRELPLVEQYTSSTLPGSCSVRFDTWQEATAFLGFEPWNAFETDDTFAKMNYAGADIPSPDNRIKHAELAFWGEEDGTVSVLTLTAGYSLGGVRVIYSLNPMTASEPQLVTTVHGSSVAVDPASFPYGEVTTSYVKPGRLIYITRDSGEKYDAVNLIFRLNFMQYTVRLIGEKDGSSLNDALTAVYGIVEQAIKND